MNATLAVSVDFPAFKWRAISFASNIYISKYKATAMTAAAAAEVATIMRCESFSILPIPNNSPFFAVAYQQKKTQCDSFGAPQKRRAYILKNQFKYDKNARNTNIPTQFEYERSHKLENVGNVLVMPAQLTNAISQCLEYVSESLCA